MSEDLPQSERSHASPETVGTGADWECLGPETLENIAEEDLSRKEGGGERGKGGKESGSGGEGEETDGGGTVEAGEGEGEGGGAASESSDWESWDD